MMIIFIEIKSKTEMRKTKVGAKRGEYSKLNEKKQKKEKNMEFMQGLAESAFNTQNSSDRHHEAQAGGLYQKRMEVFD